MKKKAPISWSLVKETFSIGGEGGIRTRGTVSRTTV